MKKLILCLVLFAFTNLVGAATPTYTCLSSYISSPLRRVASRTSVIESIFESKRWASQGRYMNVPPTPQWMLSRPQSQHTTVDTVDERWTQHYNSVDDVMYYESPENKVTPKDQTEIYVSQNEMVRVRDRGANLIKTTLPFCATGRVNAEFLPFGTHGKRIVGVGTAVVIEACLALSVAHNFLPQSLGGVRNTAKQRAKIAEFGWQFDHPSMGVTIPIDTYRLHPKWEDTFDPDYDLAVLLLSAPVREKWARPFLMGLDAKGREVIIPGYPAEVSGVVPYLQGKLMYVSDGKIIDCCDKKLHYDANTYKGNSGGPVSLRDEEEKLIGLHTRGDAAAMRNSGIKLRKDLEEFIQSTAIDFFRPDSFEHEVGRLRKDHYPDLTLSDKEENFLRSLNTLEQVKQFLDLLKR